MGRREDALAYLTQIRQLVDRHNDDSLEVPTHDGVALGLFSRSRSLLAAGTVLIEAHHPEEAMMLGRAAFTESLWLMSLDAVGDARAAYALKWSMMSLQQEAKLVRNGARYGGFTPDQADEAFDRIKGRQHQVQDYQRRHNVGQLREFGHEEKMAMQLGRANELQAFVVAHQMVHGSDVSHLFRRSFDPATQHYRFAMQSHDERLNAAVAAFLGRSALYAYRAACRIFGWPEPERFEDLLAEAVRLEETDSAATE